MARFLHLTHRYWPVPGGSESYLWQIARRQAKAGHDVTVITTDADDLAYFWDPEADAMPAGETTSDGVRIIRLAVHHLPGGRWSFGAIRRLQAGASLRSPRLARRLARFAPRLPDLPAVVARSAGPDALIFGWNITFDALTEAAYEAARHSHGRFLAVPFIHLGEDPRSSLRRYYTMPHQLERLRLAEHVIVQTEIEAAFLGANGVPAERMTIAGAGIDPETLAGGQGMAFRQAQRLRDPIVTAIGPQTHNKGTITLLEAARRLWGEGRRFELVLAGRQMADFQRYWRQLPEGERAHCHLLGPISESTKRDLLAATDVLTLPSRTESFGIVLLEAWFYGKPVIGARAGAIPAVIAEGRDGCIVAFGDVSALAGAIAGLLDDPARRRRWGERGRRKVLRDFTWDHVFERFMSAICAGGIG